MNANEYQKQAARTICPQPKALDRIKAKPHLLTQLLHAVIGKMGELGELACALEKHIWHGQDLDIVNILEEFGDDSWYTAEGLAALSADFDKVLSSNIEKLRKRFPDKYTDYDAEEKNRNREAERRILEQDAIDPPVEGGYIGSTPEEIEQVLEHIDRDWETLP